jgi:predicted nucleic acid-binding protein
LSTSPTPSHVVVDTDVFIWINRGRREAMRYVPLVAGKRIVLSFATVAELWRGAYTQGYNDASRRRLDADISAVIVVPPTNALTHAWARLTTEARAAGHPLGQKAQSHDAWVAATARNLNVPLLTDNRAHFENIAGVALLDSASAVDTASEDDDLA